MEPYKKKSPPFLVVSRVLCNEGNLPFWNHFEFPANPAVPRPSSFGEDKMRHEHWFGPLSLSVPFSWPWTEPD